ncbi:MAG: knotted carbamoyltransferase YgeW, partial [Thermodesulfobacteriota bacterium]
MTDFSQLLKDLSGLESDLYQSDFLLTWDKSVSELKRILLTAEALKHLREKGISARCFDSGLAVSNFRD